MTLLKAFAPYQLLFPLGLIHALIGVGSWLTFALGWHGYPGPAHPHHMISGFVLCFMAGFLLTAVPRFTGSRPCQPYELGLQCAVAMMAILLPHPLFAFTQLLLLLVFFGQRFRERIFPLPAPFVFIPTGLLLGLVGSALQTGYTFKILHNPIVLTASRALLYQGMVLSVLLGVGSRLISALLGWGHQDALKPGTWNLFRSKIENPLLASLFLFSFAIELIWNPSLGRLIRALPLVWVGFVRWHLLRLPQNRTALSLSIWTSAWFLLGGSLVYGLLPKFEVHSAHLIFIGGFSLSTILVASRVTLAHGGHSLDLEKKSKSILWATVLICGASLTRFLAPWTSSYFGHLGYAGLIWLLAVGIWCLTFLPKMAKAAPSVLE